MIDDATLLSRYAHDRSEEAFAELMRRHLNLVYSAALRRTEGDAHHAADVAQTVFLALARDAARLAHHAVLAGWLYTATRNAAANVTRGDQRRRRREQEAHLMNEIFSSPDPQPDWQELRPVLDAAMDELDASDREAVLVRFFQNRSFPDVADILRVSEHAARKRMERALDKLRAQLARRGITSTSAALGAVLANQTIVAAPATLAASIAGATLAQGATAAGAVWAGFFTMTKIKIGIAGAVVILTAAVVVETRASRAVEQEIGTLRSENAALTQMQKENGRLAAAAAQPVAPAPGAAELARVQTQITQLKSGPAPAASDWRPASTWKNAGIATPAATYETQLWARAHGDLDVLASTCLVTARAKARLEALMAGLAEPARSQFNTPGKLAAHIATFAPWDAGKPTAEVTAFRLLTTEESNGLGRSLKGEGALYVATRDAAGREATQGRMFTHTKDGWKYQFAPPDFQWEKIVGFLDPATAQPKDARK